VPGNVATFTLGPFAAGNAASIVAANTPAGAGNLAIVGGSPFVMDAPRRVLVTFGIEVAPRVIKISGTNITGQAISETMIVPSGGAGTKITIQDFATVTQVAVFAAWSVNMSVGTQGAAGAQGFPVASTPWFAVDIARNPVYLTVGVSRLDASAALPNGYEIEATLDDPNAAYDNPGVLAIPSSNNPQSNVPPIVYADGATIGVFTVAAAKKTANQAGPVNAGPWALRASIYDTTPAQITAQFIQAGINGA
jgi:hypothetical protein